MGVQLLPPDQSTDTAACITCIRGRVYQRCIASTHQEYTP